jgi:choline dehydrogenase-like flavoprotein
MQLVIGSGPAGVAAAHALLERGQQVTLLDAGLEIDADAAAARHRATAVLDRGGTRSELDDPLHPAGNAAGDSLPMKTMFGSDFPYRGAPGGATLAADDTAEVLISYARGGLSNIWGANVLPFTRQDLADWPVPYHAMEQAYRAVMPLIPLSAMRDDELGDSFPLHTDALEPRILSRQAVHVLADLTRHRAALAADGVVFGASRIGVTTAPRDGAPGCVRCGHCLHGCPYDLIYNSAHSLAHLLRHPRFHYRPGLYVRRYREHPDHVEVTADLLGGSGSVDFVGERLFVGCGTISTARLVLESFGRYDAPLALLDSGYFILPLLRWQATPDVRGEALQTLSQLCLRLSDAPHPAIQLLVYTYSDLLQQRLDASPLRAFPWLKQQLLDRLVVVQGYLHSDQSAGLELRLSRPSDAQAGPGLHVRALENPQAGAAMRRVQRKLWRLARQMRATPIPGAMVVGKPGKGYHSGGSFPMRCAPQGLDCDVLGRPGGAMRVHLVDSSCFPSVPATNPTLTVMANAWRIANAACDTAQNGGSA